MHGLKHKDLEKLGFDRPRAYSKIQLEETEDKLEEEIRLEEFTPPPELKIATIRHKGKLVLHSKHVLMIVVLLNLIDCILVMGELILDVHYVRELHKDTNKRSELFVAKMEALYPETLANRFDHTLADLYERLYEADCHFSKLNDNHHNETVRERRAMDDSTVANQPTAFTSLSTSLPIVIDVTNNNSSYSMTSSHRSQSTTIAPSDLSTSTKTTGQATTTTIAMSSKLTTVDDSDTNGNDNDSKIITDEEIRNETVKRLAEAINTDVTSEVINDDHKYSVWVDIAHGLHKASITILGILFVENTLKIVCMGMEFFKHKLEVFDAFVVLISFTLDLVFLKGMQEFPTEDALFILSFLLPWRVIRVVNSLIVAVLDHEHFRLKMIYMEKKIATAELERYKDLESRWDFHIKKVESFCESEGIPKWKVKQHTTMGRRSSTVSAMASLALNGIMSHLKLTLDPKALEKMNPEGSKRGSLLCIIEEDHEGDGKANTTDDDDDNSDKEQAESDQQSQADTDTTDTTDLTDNNATQRKNENEVESKVNGEAKPNGHCNIAFTIDDTGSDTTVETINEDTVTSVRL